MKASRSCLTLLLIGCRFHASGQEQRLEGAPIPINAPLQESASLVDDWVQDPDYIYKCNETKKPEFQWKLGRDDRGNVIVTTPKGNPSLKEEGPYYRTTKMWTNFEMKIEYRTKDEAPVPPMPVPNPNKIKETRDCGPGKAPDFSPNNQHFSNSGVYVFNRYEAQIVDPTKFGVNPGQEVRNEIRFVIPPPSFDFLPVEVEVSNRNQLLPAGLYSLDPPNGKFTSRGKKTGEWNVLEIVFCAPDPAPAKIQTKLNGEEVWKGDIKAGNINLTGTGESRSKLKDFVKKGYIYLQSHWGSQVDFRNPVIKELAACTL